MPEHPQHIGRWVVFVLAAVALGLAGWWGWHRGAGSPTPGAGPQGREVTLYVAPAEGGDFQTRVLRLAPDLAWVEQVKALIEDLVTQPADAQAPSLWPFSLRVRSAYLQADGVLVLDLEEGVKYNQNASATKEWQVVRSVVRTLSGNFPNVRRVKFLINGAEEETLAGHVDITRPLGSEE